MFITAKIDFIFKRCCCSLIWRSSSTAKIGYEIRPTQRSVIARQQNMTSDGGRREETELSHLTRETKNRTSQYWSHNAIKAYNFLGKAQNRSRKVDKRDTSTWISFTLFKSRFSFSPLTDFNEHFILLSLWNFAREIRARPLTTVLAEQLFHLCSRHGTRT